MKSMPSYYLLALANRTNLDLCVKYALAGFTNSVNGFWTYLEIEEGDFVSFLYGAKAWNLYEVERKAALKDAENLPPWQPITFRQSGKTYYFPFRLYLRPIRSFQESLVRDQFAYVAENLLLRGGYAKTHFQADQTTFQFVTEMGSLYPENVDALAEKAIDFEPLITFQRSNANPPQIYGFSEHILQALIKKHLRNPENLETFLSLSKVSELQGRTLEILGERALPEGHIDILIKEATPMGGVSRKVVCEVKTGNAANKDVEQLEHYIETLGAECEGGILLCGSASSKVMSYAADKGLRVLFHTFDVTGRDTLFSFSKLLSSLKIIQP